MDGIDVTTPGASVDHLRYRVATPKRRPPPWLKRHAKLAWFLAVVIFPTAITAVYYFTLAADQYVSEAKFVVRGPSAQTQGVISSLLQSTGMSRAEEDTYAVQDYIASRDALKELVQTQDLAAVYSRPEADFLSRFPVFRWRASFEHFFDYYQTHVDVLLDSSSGVSTLTVKTFRPEDSQRIATALLAAGEGLVNRMNERERGNAVDDARKEVSLAEGRVQAVARDIADFRNREAVLDPTKQSVPLLAGINDLQTMLSRTELQISQLTQSTPQSPLIADLRRRADALQVQITQARSKVTGTDASLVPKITAFDMLELQRTFADKLLASAISSLEAARLQAERQQLYLETIVKPNLSDYPLYPKRLASIATVFATLCGIYVMAALLIAGAKEHRIV